MLKGETGELEPNACPGCGGCDAGWRPWEHTSWGRRAEPHPPCTLETLMKLLLGTQAYGCTGCCGLRLHHTRGGLPCSPVCANSPATPNKGTTQLTGHLSGGTWQRGIPWQELNSPSNIFQAKTPAIPLRPGGQHPGSSPKPAHQDWSGWHQLPLPIAAYMAHMMVAHPLSLAQI